MNKHPSSPRVTRPEVARAMARLVPLIIRGGPLGFFVKRGVTQTQFLILMAIRVEERVSMGTLAKKMRVSMPTATGIVDRLARDGYVRREAGPEDRRRVLVTLTGKGERFLTDFQEVIRRRWDEVLAPLAPRELAAFHQVISKLYEQLRVGF